MKPLTRWIIALCLAGLAAGVYVLSQGAHNWRYVLPADVPAGDLLYIATFDDFTDEWALADGRKSAQVEDGALVLAVNVANDGIFAPALPRFTGFDATVTATATAGSIDNNGFGVVFRLQDPDNYAVFLISSDGYYRLDHSQNGQSRMVSAWIAHEAIAQGLNAQNTLRVIGIDDTFRFEINGVPVGLCLNPTGQSTYTGGNCLQTRNGENVPVPLEMAWVNPDLPAGQLGVALVTLHRTEDVRAVFDNLMVFAPREPTPTPINAP